LHGRAPILQRHALPATFFVATAFLNGGRMWNDTVIESLRSCSLPTIDLRELGLGTFRLGDTAERRAAIEGLLAAMKYLPTRERDSKAESLAQLCGRALPDDLMLTSEQLMRMRSAGMTIGAHTMQHPILAQLRDADAWDEISGGKLALERILGETVRLFAYPQRQARAGLPRCPCPHGEGIGFDAAFSTAHGTAGRGANAFENPALHSVGPYAAQVRSQDGAEPLASRHRQRRARWLTKARFGCRRQFGVESEGVRDRRHRVRLACERPGATAESDGRALARNARRERRVRPTGAGAASAN
jgi:peptidoglycan/xylan/chitin deacetylase (PgdA/CDA1 family)